jgi:hypothetical protein
MQHLEVSGAVRHIYVVRRLKVKKWCEFTGGIKATRHEHTGIKLGLCVMIFEIVIHKLPYCGGCTLKFPLSHSPNLSSLKLVLGHGT